MYVPFVQLLCSRASNLGSKVWLEPRWEAWSRALWLLEQNLLTRFKKKHKPKYRNMEF